MLWKRSDASERTFITFERELKKHALKEEGYLRNDFHHLFVRFERETYFGRGGMLERRFSSILDTD